MKKLFILLLITLNFFSSYHVQAVSCRDDYDYILFDLDRTLLDFDASEEHALDKIHAKYFAHMKKEDFVDTFHEINSKCWSLLEAGKYTLQDIRKSRFQIVLDQLALKNLDSTQIAKDYEKYLAEKAEWLPETKEYFFKIADKYNTAIITNGYQAVQGTRINKAGIQNSVDHVFTSEHIGHSKPSLLYFEYVFNKLKIDPQNTKILIVGDSLSSDYQSALNIKADFCWVNQNGQPLPEKYPQPDCVVKHIKELHTIMNSSSPKLQSSL